MEIEMDEFTFLGDEILVSVLLWNKEEAGLISWLVRMGAWWCHS